MRLVKPLSFLLIPAFFLGTAMAADNAAAPAASGQFRDPILRIGSDRSDVAAFSLNAPGGNSNTPVSVWMGHPGQRIELNPFAGVCFTMRSYKVKRTERFRDNESGATGYSTCQMGSNYRIRSADTHASK